MAEAGCVVEHGSDIAIRGPSLFECCCCHSSKHEPVQLKCLHYYCRSCFDSSPSGAHAQRSLVTCPACSEVNEISTLLTNSFLSTYKRVTGIRDEIVLCNTCEKNGKEEMAEFWCVVCTEALCAACFVRHNKFSNGHRIFELEHARSLSLRQLTQTVQCNLHKLAMDAHCVTCCLPKCDECLESCRAGSHDLHLLSDEFAHEHMSIVAKRVRDAAKRLGILLPSILHKCRAVASRLQSERTNGHRMLVMHRRRLHDSTLVAFNKSAGEVYCVLQRRRYEPPFVLERGVSRSCAANIEAQALSGVRSVQLLVVRQLLKAVGACCCLSSRSSIRLVLQRCEESGSISIRGSVALTCDIVLGACMGSTVRRQAALRSPLRFQDSGVILETPFTCWDLAATRDCRVLLAAGELGLLGYSDSGQQLSSWVPAKRSDGEDDEVRCVAALSDQRAAVGVFFAELIVLLRLSETGDSWQVDRHLAVLQSPPLRLSAHSDLLVANVFRRDEHQESSELPGPGWGRVLELLRLSSGQLLYTQSRDYDIRRVVLTALCVVTTSLEPVKRNSRAPYVLEAFSHSGELLWTYETSDEEYIDGLCISDDIWSHLYVTVGRRDWSSSKMMAISGPDGSHTREVMSRETNGLQLPHHLSLARGQQRTILAVVNYDGATKKASSVSLYEAIG